MFYRARSWNWIEIRNLIQFYIFETMNTIGLINCSNCQTALQVPPGATSILCAICRAVTYVSNNRAVASAAPPPNAHGRKRAVICGISYKNSRHELKGCINDAKCMRYLLVNKFGFPEDSILMLTGKRYFNFLKLFFF